MNNSKKIKPIKLVPLAQQQVSSVIGGVTRCWWIQTSPRDGNPNEGYYHCHQV